MTRPTIRQLARSEKPLVLPGAHDALSALLIKEAGFKGFFIGGFQTAGARYGLPDIGLCQLGEFSAAFRDMINACDLPVLVDADNGYGDVKNCVHLLHTVTGSRSTASRCCFVSPRPCRSRSRI